MFAFERGSVRYLFIVMLFSSFFFLNQVLTLKMGPRSAVEANHRKNATRATCLSQMMVLTVLNAVQTAMA